MGCICHFASKNRIEATPRKRDSSTFKGRFRICPRALFFIFIGEYPHRDLFAVKSVTIGELFIWENLTLTKDNADHILQAHFASGP